MNPYFRPLIAQLSQRAAEATLSILGISDPALRQFLSEQFNQPLGGKDSNNFLADPVFEAIFDWEENIHKHKMDNLAGSLLERELIDAMDKPPTELKDYAFRKDWKPYQHQYNAWLKLADSKPQSIVITSGTGSGKTECFMVPVLNDLVRQYQRQQQPLVGVQALFIYPLNALINSQRDRLRAWTVNFDNALRFCLYNGNTLETVKAHTQAQTPNEILSRTLLRSEPPPLLVTNATMLEYMLVRQNDAPILQQSQGKLRWIVLDEAHSYLGSQAAELSLLLRRVMHGFGVKAENVRFVATSATIGNKSDNLLRDYLVDLAGIAPENVTVIGGKRKIPDVGNRKGDYKKKTPITTLTEIDKGRGASKQRYRALKDHPISRKLREELTQGGGVPKSLTQLSNALFGNSDNLEQTLAWLDLCSGTALPKEDNIPERPFLPLRAHLFHQVINGLWCCVDANCSCKTGTPLADSWAFGYVYSQQREFCDCGAPVYELVFCNDCNAPHLQAQHTQHGRLVQIARQSIDEFSLHIDAEADEETGDYQEPDSTASERVYLAAKQHAERTCIYTLSARNRVLGETENAVTVHIVNTEEGETCGHCGFTPDRGRNGVFRRCLLGTPFYVSNTVPTLLEFCQDGKNPLESPGRGRRLITFTDSRQGTARIAIKIQQDSERNRLRGLVYEMVVRQAPNTDSNDKERSELIQKRNEFSEKAKRFKQMGLAEAQDFLDFAAEKQQQIEQLNEAQPLTWENAVNGLQANPDIAYPMLEYYRDNLMALPFQGGSGSRTLSAMLLIREFNRRAKRQNTLETLGLVAVNYPGLNKIKQFPKEWQKLLESQNKLLLSHEESLKDWQGFLKICLDFYVRDNFIAIPNDWVNWIGVTIYPKTLLAPDSKELTGKRIGKWPLVRKGRNNRLIRILAYALNLNVENKAHEDMLNQIMREAWKALTLESQILTPVAGSFTYQMKPEQMAFSAIQTVWICPVTHRLLDTTFKDVTPYLPYAPTAESAMCEKVTIPVLPAKHDFNSMQEKLAFVREWIADNAEIVALRQQNLWTDLSDRILEGGVFFRTAEHSAQQPASRLQYFEKLFKEEKLNVLSCSTTMEMGVDIGGISVVAMNNAPPHPANYLQRAGRAGRRQESRALAFTMCKDNPHERAVFKDPLWPFITQIKSPYITLNSQKIVQRHVNSLILSYFLNQVIAVNQQQNTKLDCGWFFCKQDEGNSQVERFCAWLAECEINMPKTLKNGLQAVVDKTILAGTNPANLLQQSASVISEIGGKWLSEYEPLQTEFDSLNAKIAEKNPYRKRVERDLQRLKGEYLLAELAARGFLPGYGFPTGLAYFDPYSVHDYQPKSNKPKDGREDNLRRIRDKPTRDLSIAIREYAPGNDIVLNGLVYRSAGLALSWHNPESGGNETQKLMTAWRCDHCGAIDHALSSLDNTVCHECGRGLIPEHKHEFIEPAGFAVDFYESPSTDISKQHYIPFKEPWVTAKDRLRPLPNPHTGLFRSGNRGDIFYYSAGEHKHGYALCWHCGRADSMTADNNLPEIFSKTKPHNRLRGKQEGQEHAECSGNGNESAIKHNLYLGYVHHTDVLELYLKRLNEQEFLNYTDDDSQKIAWTLSVALRQALADTLGINADELGYTVKPTKLPGCHYPVATIVLYDTASGGAGFASSAHRDFAGLFNKAKHYLECTCQSVCQNCLLGFDTRFHIDQLDRHLALAFLTDDFIYALALPDELKLLGENSRYTSEILFTEIHQAAGKGATDLHLVLHGNPAAWEILGALREHLTRWQSLYTAIVLLINEAQEQQLTNDVKEDLWVLQRLGIKTAVIAADKRLSKSMGSVIAQALFTNQQRTFACTSQQTIAPSKSWLDDAENLLIFADDFPLIPTSYYLEAAQLKPQAGSGDVEIEIWAECNGKLTDFAKMYWRLVTEKHQPLQQHLKNGDELKSICYSDRYLCSPWTLILIAELIDGLKEVLQGNWSKPEIHIHTASKRISDSYQRKGILADWLDDSLRLRVIEAYFAAMDEHCVAKASNDTQHGRFLHLCWQSGTTTTLRFDQGVSYWGCDKSPYYDNALAANDQADRLMEMAQRLTVKNQKDFPTQIFVKER